MAHRIVEIERIVVELIPVGQVNEGVRRHLSLSEASAELGVSTSWIRSRARSLGVSRIAGRTVRGGILITQSIAALPLPIVITYAQ